jgi:hypothetical protein
LSPVAHRPPPFWANGEAATEEAEGSANLRVGRCIHRIVEEANYVLNIHSYANRLVIRKMNN